MRLFTALDLPPDMLQKLAELLAQLIPQAQLKWSPLENLHITTKFIGEWPEARMQELDKTLKRLRSSRPIDVHLGGLGWFPTAHSPRVLWVGVNGGQVLTALATQTDQALAALGVAPEPHQFSPHLTLARIKGGTPLQGLRAKVEELQATEIGRFLATGFYLYSSEPGPRASVYRKLQTYQFEQP